MKKYSITATGRITNVYSQKADGNPFTNANGKTYKIIKANADMMNEETGQTLKGQITCALYAGHSSFDEIAVGDERGFGLESQSAEIYKNKLQEWKASGKAGRKPTAFFNLVDIDTDLGDFI